MTEDPFVIPMLREPKNPEELSGQLAVLSEAIERCEKMLQHLAAGALNDVGVDSELDFYMSKHLELLGIQRTLQEKRKKWEDEGTIIS